MKESYHKILSFDSELKKAEKFKLPDIKDSSFYLRSPLREQRERERAEEHDGV